MVEHVILAFSQQHRLIYNQASPNSYVRAVVLGGFCWGWGYAVC